MKFNLKFSPTFFFTLTSLALCCLLSACSVAELRRDSMPVHLHQFQFSDGGKAIYFEMERKPWQSGYADTPLANLLFVISGSDCVSMGPFLPQYFFGLEGESGRTRIFILHKRHILPGSNGAKCGEHYIRADHPSRWQADQLEFMRAQIAKLQAQTQKPQRLIMMGISEGAELAPLLAQQLHASHLVLLSHAGMNALDVYAALARQNPAMQPAWQQLQDGLSVTASDPDSLRIHGRSWRYWSEIAHIPQTANLLALDIPILLGVGEADPVIPEKSIAHLQQQFQAAGKVIDIRRFPDAGHSLSSKDKNYLPDFMHQIDNWLLDARR
ncbi:alpha/beta hydrolase family protein [Undibacterium pigrum]|uniref:Dienelactone hydrolase family protein n=1 Tax=Undibacterium pigrum TaxID=401470 RepID=A0A318J686_9BURK|nr:dienelactone hydrolase family protein [Undibacterium pigrum]PXX42121.1 dienelactone hydrolase family protein [Undibacterium pigrum]